LSEYALEFEKPILELEKRLEELKRLSVGSKEELSSEIDQLDEQIGELKTKVYSKLTPWQRVQIARHPDRPLARDYIEMVFHDFTELHGDRLFGDDAAIISGPAFLDGQAVMVIGQQKGRGTKERVACNFGSPHPEGYRKSRRLMRLAEKFNLLPVESPAEPAGIPRRLLVDVRSAIANLGFGPRDVESAVRALKAPDKGPADLEALVRQAIAHLSAR